METPTTSDGRIAEFRSSARGWHGVQLAVLGFIGLCGVLQGQADSSAPRWLQVLSGLLVVLALVLSCVATALVASAAWPVSGWRTPGESPVADAADLTEGGRRLRLGVGLTFVAVGTLALAAMSTWWPSDNSGGDAAAGSVSVTTNAGSICGEIAEGSPGVLVIQAATQQVSLRMDSVVSIVPVDSCE